MMEENDARGDEVEAMRAIFPDISLLPSPLVGVSMVCPTYPTKEPWTGKSDRDDQVEVSFVLPDGYPATQLPTFRLRPLHRKFSTYRLRGLHSLLQSHAEACKGREMLFDLIQQANDFLLSDLPDRAFNHLEPMPDELTSQAVVATAQASASDAEKEEIEAEIFEELDREKNPGQALRVWLKDMPAEVKLTIAQFLGVRDLVNLGSTCREWNAITKDDLLWKSVFFTLSHTVNALAMRVAESVKPETSAEVDRQRLVAVVEQAEGNWLAKTRAWGLGLKTFSAIKGSIAKCDVSFDKDYDIMKILCIGEKEDEDTRNAGNYWLVAASPRQIFTYHFGSAQLNGVGSSEAITCLCSLRRCDGTPIVVTASRDKIRTWDFISSQAAGNKLVKGLEFRRGDRPSKSEEKNVRHLVAASCPGIRRDLIIAAGSKVLVWDITKPTEPLYEWTRGRQVTFISFLDRRSANPLLAITRSDGSVQLMDLKTGKARTKMQLPKEAHFSQQESEGTSSLLVWVDSTELVVWDVRTPLAEATRIVPKARSIKAMSAYLEPYAGDDEHMCVGRVCCVTHNSDVILWQVLRDTLTTKLRIEEIKRKSWVPPHRDDLTPFVDRRCYGYTTQSKSYIWPRIGARRTPVFLHLPDQSFVFAMRGNLHWVASRQARAHFAFEYWQAAANTFAKPK